MIVDLIKKFPEITILASGIEKPRKRTKNEQNKYCLDIPAEMDGGLKKKGINVLS